MKKRLLIIIILLIAAGTAFFYHNAPLGSNSDRSTIKVSGNIDVTEALMSFRIPGRLLSRTVAEGDHVTAGQLLAQLDPKDQEIAVRQAEANLALAQAGLAELEAGSRQQEIMAAQATLEQAQAVEHAAVTRMAQAETDYRRYRTLRQDNGVSQAAFEDYKTRFETSQNTRQEAAARVAAAEEQLDLLKAGPRQERIDQAHAQVRSAEATLEYARQQLTYTKLHAPQDGIVLTTTAETGEYLSSGSPVLTIGDLDHPWLRAYINEPDLGRVGLNQEARVSTDSYPDRLYSGRIIFISSQAEFTPKSVQTHEERVKLMYRIKIDLNNQNQELKPGMPADAVIELSAQ